VFIMPYRIYQKYKASANSNSRPNRSSNSSPIAKEGVFVTRINGTSRSLLWRLKRWFYASIRQYLETLGSDIFDEELSKSFWAQISSAIVEYTNENGLVETPVQAEVHYKLQNLNGKLAFTITSVTLKFFKEFKSETITYQYKEKEQ